MVDATFMYKGQLLAECGARRSPFALKGSLVIGDGAKGARWAVWPRRSLDELPSPAVLGAISASMR